MSTRKNSHVTLAPQSPRRRAASRRQVPSIEYAVFVAISIFASLFLVSGMAVAAPQVISATMTGAQATPSNTSTATGTCSASVDSTTLLATFSGTFTGLAAQATAAYLRGPVGFGAVGPVILPKSNVTAGLSGTFQGSGLVTAGQAAALLAGQTYCEIDDATFPTGEIRGQLTTLAPAPAMAPWGVAGLALLLAWAGIASRRKTRPPVVRAL